MTMLLPKISLQLFTKTKMKNFNQKKYYAHLSLLALEQGMCQTFIQKTKSESPNGKSVHWKLNSINAKVAII